MGLCIAISMVGMNQISVAVINDLPLMRQALSSFVRREPQFDLVAEGADGNEAVRIAEELTPDVFLMDLQMPQMNGVEATRNILARFPHTKILAITTFYSDDYVIPALQAGVHGYLLKDARPQEVIGAIFSAMRGQAVLSQRAVDSLAGGIGAYRQPPQQDAFFGESLTAAEQKVLDALCQGMSNKEISKTLFLAESTVKATVSRIMQKMQVSSRLQIIVKAAQHHFFLK